MSINQVKKIKNVQFHSSFKKWKIQNCIKKVNNASIKYLKYNFLNYT